MDWVHEWLSLMKGNTVEKKHTLGKQQVAMQDPNRTFHDAGKAESH